MSRKVRRNKVEAVFIDAANDADTRPAYAFRKNSVLPYVAGKGVTVTPLPKNKANSADVKRALQVPAVRYVSGAGHGTWSMFQGKGGKALFKTGTKYGTQLKGRIVHLLSCYTARGLGPDLVRNGKAAAFFGYLNLFKFAGSDPALCLELDAEIDRGLADGLSASQVHRRVLKQYDVAIAKMERTGNDYFKNYLIQNRNSLRGPIDGRSFGSGNARLRRSKG